MWFRFLMIILIVAVLTACESGEVDKIKEEEVYTSDCVEDLREIYEQLVSKYTSPNYYDEAKELFYLKTQEEYAINRLSTPSVKKPGFSSVDGYLRNLFETLRKEQLNILEITEYGARCGKKKSELVLKISTVIEYRDVVYSRNIAYFEKVDNQWKLLRIAAEAQDDAARYDKGITFKQWGKRV